MIFLAISYICIVLHELGHIILFRIQKVELVKIVIFPFAFTKNNGKWKIRIYFNISYLGIVIPKIPVLNYANEKQFNSCYRKAILAGPCVNIILVSFSMIFLFKYNSRPLYYTLFFNILILIDCFSESKSVMGDMIAYKRISKYREIYLLVLFSAYIVDSRGEEENYVYFQNEFNKLLSKDLNENIHNRLLSLYKRYYVDTL